MESTMVTFTLLAGLSPTDLNRIETVETAGWLDLFGAAPADVAFELGLERRRIGEDTFFMSRGLDDLTFNRLSLASLSPPRGEVVDAAIAEFEAARVRNWVVQVPDGSRSHDTLRQSRGLVQHRRTWARFVRGVEAFHARTDLSIRAADRDTAQSFGEVAARGFGLPRPAARWLSSIVGRPGWHCFMAFDGETPVATSAIFIDGSAGWLGVAATLPDYRGRGAQPALLAARIDAAARQGCTILTTETGVPLPGEPGPSYANIQRAGFRIAHLRLNLCKPPS
jgi:GNAT superfamily N-acetyltransferase